MSMFLTQLLYIRQGVFLSCVWILLLNIGGSKMSQGPKPNCKSNAHVCTTIMKYPDGSEFDEGPYCMCDGCSSKWIANDYKSLSWPHHERADKTVQYKFCIPIIPMRECDDPGVPAITMSTETDEWSPHIRDARCACADHKYQLLAWYRHPLHRYDNSSGLWIYEYFCDKPECTINSYPCAKIYVDSHFDRKITGYNFLCACPKGYKCPDYDEDEEDTPETETDKNGEYIPRYCEPVHKRMAPTTTPSPPELLS